MWDLNKEENYTLTFESHGENHGETITCVAYSSHKGTNVRRNCKILTWVKTNIKTDFHYNLPRLEVIKSFKMDIIKIHTR